MKKILFLGIGLACLACQPNTHKAYTTLDGFAQGTTYHIVYANTLERNLQPEVDSILNAFDLSLSLYKEQSLLTKINNNQTDCTDLLFDECFSISKDVYEKTGGCFDVTGNPLFQLWGFGKGERARKWSDKHIDSILQFVGMNKVHITDGKIIKKDPRITLNFNAIAQGYSVDVVARYFDRLGLEHYLIEIGGEIFCKGINAKQKPWVVGIDKPYDNNNTPGESIQAYISLSGEGLATSGNYRKFYVIDGKKYAHTIHPLTGKPAQNSVLSATVVAPSSALADAVATAYMVMGMDQIKTLEDRFPDCDVYLIYDKEGEYREYISKGMKKRLKHKV